jgi:hypothetical protein
VLITQYCFGDQIENNEMVGAFSTYAGQQKYIQRFGGNLKERDHLEDPGLCGRIIFRWIFRKWDVRTGMGSICLRIRTGSGHL